MPPTGRTSSKCGACQYYRKKCTPDCFLAPYFPPDDPEMYCNVHKVFGGANIKKMLRKANTQDERTECVKSLVYEARIRLHDPIYGCAGLISRLKETVETAEQEMADRRRQQLVVNNQEQLIGGPPSNIDLSPHDNSSNQIIQQQPEHGQNALATSSPEQHQDDPTGVLPTTDATASGSTSTESWDVEKVKDLYEKVCKDDQEEQEVSE